MTLTPQLTTLLVVSMLAGWLMTLTGVKKRGLEWRQRRRICPSCGREIESRVCGCNCS